MRDILLSIVIPVYNVEKYLDRCLQSILEQPIKDCEIILVNDGSTDDSGTLCNSYSDRYDYISVIDKENGGLASARNAGLEAAKGEYVSFLDSDDWMRNDSYSILLGIIEQYKPDVIGFGCNKTTDAEVYNQYCQLWKEGLHSESEMQTIHEDIITGKHVFKFEVIRSSCMHVFRREMLECLNLHFISERILLNEDYLFVTTAILNAKTYYCCKEYLYYYYTRENSLTMRYLKEMYERKLNLMKEYYDMATENSFSEEQNYRLGIFYINNCYECLANECSAKKPDFVRIKQVLRDQKLQDYIRRIRMNEQGHKAKIFIGLIKTQNAIVYLMAYRVFSVLKSMRFRLKKKS